MREDHDNSLTGTTHVDADDWYQIARKAHEKGEHGEAIHAYQMALKHHRESAASYHNLGLVLYKEGCFTAAISCYRRALHLAPDDADTWSNLGNVYRRISDLEQAETCLRHAIQLAGKEPDFAFNLGMILRDKGCLDEAENWLRYAVKAMPEQAEQAFELAITLLQAGKFKEGFKGYERRFDVKRFSTREFALPKWTGNPINGNRLLVYAEQGHGDLIQFARFIPKLLIHSDGEIILECHSNLKRLFAANFPEISVIEVGEDLPDCDQCISIMSLAHLLSFDENTPQFKIPYLRVPENICTPVTIPPRTDRLRVGVTWAGNQTFRDRSCPFEEFIAISEVPCIELYSLQRGDRIADIKTHGCEALVSELGSSLQDFADDAALLEQLDLVITIDTAICHLAAALGKPTWTLLNFVADWRFHQSRNDSPWYPTMRLFRQPEPGDWRSVISDVKQALADLKSLCRY